MIKEKKYKIIKNIILTIALISSLVITQPLYIETVHAAAIEDCDLDGYDDHTGNPVPWIGFDSTKGESLPPDWDGKTTYKSKKAYEDAHKKEEVTEAPTKSSSVSTNNTNNANKNTNSSSNSSSTKKSTSSKTTTSSSTTKKSTTSSTTKKTTNNNTSKSDNTKATNEDKNNEENNSEKAEEQIEETTDTEKKSKKKKKKKKSSKSDEKETSEVEEISVEEQVVDIVAGELEITDAEGSIIHVGGKLVITGYGFTGNVEDIEVEIHSDNAISLGNFNTLEDGSFETVVSIPENLVAGEHEIVLKYHGETIAEQSIQVGEKVADTFLSALTVGFTKQNQGLIPGLVLLFGLFSAGILTLVIGGFKKA